MVLHLGGIAFAFVLGHVYVLFCSSSLDVLFRPVRQPLFSRLHWCHPCTHRYPHQRLQCAVFLVALGCSSVRPPHITRCCAGWHVP